MKRIVVALTATMMMLVLTSAYAADVLIKGRNVQQKSEVVIHQQAEDKSYGSGTYRTQGLTFLEDGKVATYVNQGAFSWDGGGSRHTGFTVRKYPDGAMMTVRYAGNSRKGEGQKVREWDGTAEVISGTGRFQDAKGHGTYEGGRYANGMAVTDWEMKAVLAQ